MQAEFEKNIKIYNVPDAGLDFFYFCDDQPCFFRLQQIGVDVCTAWLEGRDSTMAQLRQYQYNLCGRGGGDASVFVSSLRAGCVDASVVTLGEGNPTR